MVQTTQTQELDPQVRAALFDLQRYLSDEIASLMVAPSMEMLLGYSPELTGAAIRNWLVAQQGRAQGVASISEYLFHCMKKIHQMAELELIGAEEMKRFLDKLGAVVLGLCPDAERDTLRNSLENLGRAETVLAAPVERLHRQVGSEPAAAPGSPAAPGAQAGDQVAKVETSRALRRFSLLFQRLEDQFRAGGTGALVPTIGVEGNKTAGPTDQLQAQILTNAAIGARTGQEFNQHLHRLGQMGVNARTGEVLRTLGDNLPAWSLPGGSPLPLSGAARAMHRIVSMAADQEEGSQRFAELLQAGTEQFNGGSLVRAARIVELAEKIVSEGKLNPEMVTSIRKRGSDALSPEQMRTFAEDPERHHQLRKILDFYPQLDPAVLLDELDGEPKRERRRLLLTLLEVHGEAGRREALRKMVKDMKEPGNDPDGFYRRNLLCLMRRIPRSDGTSLEKELVLLEKQSQPGNPPMVIRESIGVIGQMKDKKAVRLLIKRLRECEKMLLDGKVAGDPEEIQVLLDRTTSALARLGEPESSRAVVEHGLNRTDSLGNTLARLRDLGNLDLSSDPELVERLVGAVRDELPGKLLRFTIKKNNENIESLLQALAGTRHRAVTELLQEIAERYPRQSCGETATRLLEATTTTVRQAEEAAPESLSGDVELFGLPNLLQSLADNQVTGVLTLTGKDGNLVARLEFDAGDVQRCQAGIREGEAAFYQLLEVPVPATFSFKGGRQSQPAAGEQKHDCIKVHATLFEAVRRYDELQQVRVLVPDEAVLTSTGTKPSRPPDEKDVKLVKTLWKEVTAGSTPAHCESEIPLDSYRIRQILAHWLEEGALRAA